MKPIERAKAQKLVNRILSNEFDENDVDSLFMKMRAYSAGFPIFREVSDFVAHNDLRDRGIANQSLETMYLRMKYFFEYNSPERTLDISQPFPLWIKRLMKYQVYKCDEKQLREKFNVTRERLASRIDNAFKEDQKNKIAVYKNGKLSADTFRAIQHIMSFISGNPAFTQNDLIDDLVGVLTKNKISFDEQAFRSLSDKITLCTLLLFHNAEFDFKGHKKGSCHISSEHSSVSHNVRFVDPEGNEIEHKESFGNLAISGSVTIRKDGKDLSIGHCVMSTNLPAELWCADDLFHIEPLSENAPGHLYKKLKLQVDLRINNDFQLCQTGA